MKYKATADYVKLSNGENFISLQSASTHLILLAGEVVEWNKPLPKTIKDTLTEVKSKTKE